MVYKALESCNWEDVLKDIRKFEESDYWGDPTPKWTSALADELNSHIYNSRVLTAARDWVISEQELMIERLRDHVYCLEDRIDFLEERLEGNE